MNWLSKLEQKLGRFAIPNLMTYIVGLNGLIFILTYIDRTGSVLHYLMLIPSLVMQGEFWRLITYVFIPPNLSPIWIFFTLYFYYMIGNGLEQEWGSFRFNLYYLLGMIGTTLAAFITGGGATATYINLSLFLAFARIYPDFELLIFFVLPVKIKYLAWLNWAFIGFTILTAALPVKVTAIVAIINYFIFFGKEIQTGTVRRRQVYENRKRFESQIPKDFTIHKCVVCGKTEKDDPKLEFRYCAKCEGDYEYCMEHLQTHDHVVSGDNNQLLH